MNHKPLVDEIVGRSTPIKNIDDLTPLIQQVKDRKIVMLGESTHGTQEFYDLRRHISKELIQNHGFSFIAVEGDWPSCQFINEFIQGNESRDSISTMLRFSRWPTWMWANAEMMELMDDLYDWNEKALSPAGFYGLDVYSLYESMDEVLRLLQEIDPGSAGRVKDLYSCFGPFRHDERAYVRSLIRFPEGCAEQVAEALQKILDARLGEDLGSLNLIQNARIIQNAEKYYRAMVSIEDESWNIRDRHMMDTLDMLLGHHGPQAKAIVWAHNTHVGDYRATDMLVHGQVNLGGLARQKYGVHDTALIGFTTYKGKVLASKEWDGETEVLDLPEAKPASLESHLHHAIAGVGHKDFYTDLENVRSDSPLSEFTVSRAVGVVYDPDLEHLGNYVPTVPAARYDGIVFCDKTSALTPLNVKYETSKIPETYPFGNRM